MKNNTEIYYSPRQGRLPLFITDFLDICDPVLAFDSVNMLKTILFGFMDTGYASLRELEDRCRTNIRYIYLMDDEKPSYRAFSHFINEEIKESVQLFAKITGLLEEMNETLAYAGLKIVTNTGYTPKGLETVLSRYTFLCHVDEKKFVSGGGHGKSLEQRYYEKLKEYTEKLREYVVRIKTCGPERNSYSKTDHGEKESSDRKRQYFHYKIS